MRVAVRRSDAADDEGCGAADDGDRSALDLVDPAADADVLVTVGEAALRAAAAVGERRPVLAVGLDGGWVDDAASNASLSAALDALAGVAADGSASLPTVSHRPMTVSAGGATATAVADCTVVTTEPARISEYAVAHGGRTLATFRADGVVVTTPLGSGGYARAAGGPRLAPGTGLAVVPIAPFATKADTWVLTPPLRVTVEREEDTTVFADDRAVTAGGPGLAVRIAAAEPLTVVDPVALSAPRQVEKL